MTVSGISFVVIARDEEFAAEKCLRAIVDLPLEDCEILCVDSGSKDRTLEVFRSFADQGVPVRIFRINGYSNAAVARNVGLKEAVKPLIFFVDGDVELEERFFREALRALEEGEDAVTGELAEVQYSTGYRDVERVLPSISRIRTRRRFFVSGGIFLVRRAAALEAGFFDERFERCQDLEYTLRLTRRSKMAGLPVKMGVHHTIPYHDGGRIREGLRKGFFIYLGMALARNLGNPRGAFQLIARILPGIFLGFCLILLLIAALVLNVKAFWVLAPAVPALDGLYGVIQKKQVGYRMLLHYVAPFHLAVGLFVTLDPRRSYEIHEIKEALNESFDRQ